MAIKVTIEGPGTTVVGPTLDEYTKDTRNADKYSTAITFAKDNKALLEASRKAIEAVAEEATKTTWGGKQPRDIYACLRDGDHDRPDNTLFADKFFCNAKTSKTPVLLTSDGQPADASAFVTGTPVRAEISFYGYNYMGRIGVAVGLERLWLDDAPEQSSVPLDEDDF